MKNPFEKGDACPRSTISICPRGRVKSVASQVGKQPRPSLLEGRKLMPGSVLVPFDGVLDVFIDNQRCGVTNIPFDVEVGTHDIDLGTPPSQRIIVLSSHTPLNPLIVQFQEQP
jgi:hypothetical protein